MYGEVAIAVNSAFNYLLLSFADKVCHRPAKKWRILAAAVAGAVPVVVFGGHPVPMIAAFLFMIFTAFGLRRNSVFKGAGATLTAALFAGGLLTVLKPTGFGIGGTSAVLTSCLFASGGLHLLAVRWRGAAEDAGSASFRVDTELSLFGSEVPLAAFADTGNACTEPLSGAPVHFISYRAVKDHLPGEVQEVLERLPADGMPDLNEFPSRYRTGLRLIPVSTVSGKSWTVGFKISEWMITGPGEGRIGGYFVLTANNAEYPLGADAILHRSALVKTKERGSTHADRS